MFALSQLHGFNANLSFDGCNDPLTDPYWADVVFLCHGDALTDEKGHTISATGAVSVETSTKLFGTGTIWNNGTLDGNSYSQLAYSADFDLGSTWTIEGANYSIANGDCLDFIGFIDSGGDSWAGRLHIERSCAGYLEARVYDSSAGSTLFTGTTLIPDDTFFRWAFVDDGGTYYLFLNGNLEATGTHGSLITHNNSGITIGARYPGVGTWKGYWEEYRITKGIARYTSSYTPACRAFPNS